MHDLQPTPESGKPERENMDTYYLRIEGVNLANFIYDTADLSTIRGGSMLLDEGVYRVFSELQQFAPSGSKIEMGLVSLGASVGLFKFSADEKAAREVAEEARKILNSDRDFRHGTFVVNVLQKSSHGNFVWHSEGLKALNRFQQMQSPSLSVPSRPDPKQVKDLQTGIAGTAVPVCSIDLVRPATARIDGPGGSRPWVSGSVKSRCLEGRKGKREAFATLLHETDLLDEFGLDYELARDFERLCSRPGHPLHNKMAVIYADGNSFGATQDKHCKSDSDQKAFNDTLEDFKKRLLRGLERQVGENKKDWLPEGAGPLRFQWLMWGGDDLLWVLPAWLGMDALEVLFSAQKGLKFNSTNINYSAGIAFCHHRAHIHEMSNVVHELVDLAKKRKSTGHFAYLVLESFDHIGRDLEEYLKKRLPAAIKPEDLLLPGDMTKSIRTSAPELKEKVSRRALHRFARALVSGDLERAKTLRKALREGLGNEQDLLEPLGGREKDVSWVHLLELWDYLPGKEH